MDTTDKIISNINETSRGTGRICNSSNNEMWENIANAIDNCMIPALNKPFDEISSIREVEHQYEQHRQTYLPKLDEIHRLLTVLFKNKISHPLNTQFVSSLIIFIEQIEHEGPWEVLLNDEKLNDNLDEIVLWFNTHCAIYTSEDKVYKEEVFIITMKKIHSFLTQTKWKCYPALVEAYRAIVSGMAKPIKLNCHLHIAFPATLMQLDDCVAETKLHGLKCCRHLLENLNFEKTGYEDAVFDTLTKLLLFTDESTLQELLNCLLLIAPIYAKKTSSQWTKCDDLFEIILDNLNLETDIAKKNAYLDFIPNYINIVGNSAIRWKKKIMNILTEGIDLSHRYTPADCEIVNKCVVLLITWIKIGWPVWSCFADHDLLIQLFKLLFICYEGATVIENVDVENIEKCIITIFCIYTEQQRRDVLDEQEQGQDPETSSEEFLIRWRLIKKTILNTCESSDISEKVEFLNLDSNESV